MGLCLGVVKHPQQHIGHIAAILPVAQAAHGCDLGGAQAVGDEVEAAEEVHKQVAAHAGAIVEVVAPPEEAQRIECVLLVDLVPVPGHGLR